ncbi:MAG: ASKHA domain-containing protein [Limnochordia bacterium]|jgi:uncharacterized 2Fe-2S/4Fe-4S cluster protein (DUF4445 family)
MAKVRFFFSAGGGREIDLPPGATILQGARTLGIDLGAICNARGRCGHCRVQVVGDFSPPTPEERRLLTRDQLDQGIRLACQTKINGPAQVYLSPRPLGEGQILIDGSPREIPLDPGWQKIKSQIRQPSLTDLDGLYERLPGAYQLSLHQLRQLPTLTDGELTITSCDGQVLALEAGDTTAHLYGLAFDLGTTTVVGSLVDLRTGRELAVAGAPNGQALYGADVLSRIQYAVENPDGLVKLQKAILATLNGICDQLCQRTGIDARWIYGATMAGNTCMQHLLLGVDPGSLGVAPYVPVWCSPLSCSAGELGLAINPQGRVFCLPHIAGFVGADTVAVMLATDLMNVQEPTLVIDIGTNGEIVLAGKGQIWACSTAAGPAFEGAQISCGMAGLPGAIERVDFIDGEVSYQVIGGGEARGICGSGLVDVVAGLLEEGLLEPSGRLLDPTEHPHGGLVEGPAFSLAPGVAITQRDIRELQLAKGAIYAGIQILLGEARLKPQQIILAGAFGSYLRREKALALGLFPPLPLEKINTVGNAARIGAQMALLSQPLRQQAQELARQVHYVELAGRPDFQMEFAQAMFFPGEEEY